MSEKRIKEILDELISFYIEQTTGTSYCAIDKEELDKIKELTILGLKSKRLKAIAEMTRLDDEIFGFDL